MKSITCVEAHLSNGLLFLCVTDGIEVKFHQVFDKLIHKKPFINVSGLLLIDYNSLSYESLLYHGDIGEDSPPPANNDLLAYSDRCKDVRIIASRDIVKNDDHWRWITGPWKDPEPITQERTQEIDQYLRYLQLQEEEKQRRKEEQAKLATQAEVIRRLDQGRSR